MFASDHQEPSVPIRPRARGTFTAFGARHVRGVALTRWVLACGFVIAGVVLVALGRWWGLVFFGAAALNGSFAYFVPRWNPPGGTPDNAAHSV